ncbi:hypothetical protein F5887DRAFT_1178443 [Amanita rubescens]|nr:hypothetical protein F5887DRAFT_1178443 [Amanita rubescens]
MPSIHHVPAEIVREIFSHLSSPLRIHTAHEFPWYLGQICSLMRAIFLSMQPCFWNELEIEYPERDSRQLGFARTMEMLALFLDNTRGAPFSFALFKETGDSTRIGSSYVQPIILNLLNYSMQWKSVSLTLQMEDFPLLRSVKNRLPLLQNMELVLSQYGVEDYLYLAEALPDLGVSNIFEGTPLLAHVKLCCLSDALWRFNGAVLTTLYLMSHSFCNPQSVIFILRQAINLEELTIGDTYLDTDFSTVGNSGAVKLPRLKYLNTQTMHVLNIIKAPALKVLKIDFWHVNSQDIGLQQDMARITIDFLLRSDCKLSVLSATFIGSLALREVLSYVPDLERLSLHRTRLLSEVVEWLAGSRSGTAGAAQSRELPLPRLNMLWLNSYENKYLLHTSAETIHPHTYLEALYNMVSHRNPPGTVRDPSPKNLYLQEPGKERVVFTGPVRSGFLPKFGKTVTVTGH